MTFSEFKASLIEGLKKNNVEEYEIYYSSKSESTVETLNREISAFSSGVRGGVCLRVRVDNKIGYAATEYFSADEAEELVMCALGNAAVSEKEDKLGFHSGSESYLENKKSCSVLPPEELKRCALGLAAEIYNTSKNVTDGTSTTAVGYEYSVEITNSRGLNLKNNCGVSALVGEAVIELDGEKQADYSMMEYSEGSLPKIASEAVNGAIGKVGAILPPSGKYGIVIDSKAMRSVLSVFASAFSAKAALEGMSRLKGMEGQMIASELITLTDDPMREGSPIATPFDAEGVATSKRAIIDKGVLTTLLHNRESAARMNTETTANASKASYSSTIGISPHSFCIERGEYEREELFTLMGNGILITELKGLHAGANAVTGDFSLESEGYMIRDGKIAEAAASFTVAGNFFDLLKSVAAVGRDLYLGVPMGSTGYGAPSVYLPEMSIAGK